MSRRALLTALVVLVLAPAIANAAKVPGLNPEAFDLPDGTIVVVPPAPPALDDHCTARFLDRDVQVSPDGTFILPNMPVPTGLYKVRITCLEPDGSVVTAESDYLELVRNDATPLGALHFGPITPIPLGLRVEADRTTLAAALDTVQLHAFGLLPDGTVEERTTRAKGTTYTSSNAALATVSNDGLVTAGGGRGTVVISVNNEGTQATFALRIGAAGTVRGTLVRTLAGGSSAVPAATVGLFRAIPFSQLAVAETDAQGQYAFTEVPVGNLLVRATDPQTGQRVQATTALTTNGEVRQVDLTLTGQGTVVVTVLGSNNQPLSGAVVTLTSQVPGTPAQFATTASPVTFTNVPAGAFTISARDTATNLIGFAAGTAVAGETTNVTVRIQPTGAIAGVVHSPSGAGVGGLNVRLLSGLLGLVAQTTSGADGSYRFDAVPLNGNPYTLDALDQGRRRARAADLNVMQGQDLPQDLTLIGLGTVTGMVTDPDGLADPQADVTVQSQNAILPLTLTTRPNAQGRYVLAGVPVGDFTLTGIDAGRRLRADAAGRIDTDGQEVTRDLALRASNTGAITGTVFGRDGHTQVGAGVTVRVSGPDTLTVMTNAVGQFRAEPLAVGNYTIECSDASGNQGRAFAVIASSGQTTTGNCAFVGIGAVTGTVRRATGETVPNAPVSLSSNSIFGGFQATTTDTQGRYSVFNIFVGPFSVSAQDTVSGVGGFATGTLLADGQTATADVTLQASGTVQGSVLQADRVTLVAGAQVTLQGRTVTTGADGSYRFSFVPLGSFGLEAVASNGDRGRASSQIVAAGETRTVNIVLNGLGQVTALVRTAAGQPVGGATVTLQGTTQFGGTQTGTSAADGHIDFSGVLAGGFNLAAVDPVSRLGGFTTGRVSAGQTASVVVTLEASGTIRGTAFGPGGGPPPSGTVVILRRSGLAEVARVTASSAGSFEFGVVPIAGSPFTLDAEVAGRLRGRETGIQLTSQGQEVTRNVTLVGTGTVTGLVTLSGGAQAGVPVSVQSQSFVGGFFGAVTNPSGRYTVDGVPDGPFTATVNSGQLFGQTAGTLVTDGQTVTANIALVSNARNTPITLVDVNSFSFDIQQNGSVLNGVSQVFRGDLNLNQGGSLLDLIVNNVPIRFAGDSAVASAELEDRQIVVRDTNLFTGLNVTRKAFVARDGYFVRYLDTIENRTTGDVTVGARVLTNLRSASGGPRVIGTSSGDDLLAGDEDRWVVVDDSVDNDPFRVSGTPAVAQVFAGPGAAQPVGLAGLEVLGANNAQLTVRFDSITIPAGGSVSLLHFFVQQTSQASAQASAQRLVQLPPEALAGLTPTELAQIRNFAPPLDGVSEQAALPPLTARVMGTILEGDDTTAVPGASILFQSQNPIFARTLTFFSDGSGNFDFSGNVNARVPIPAGDFTLRATHPATSLLSPLVAGTFAPGTSVTTRDIVFTNAGLAGGTVRTAQGAPVTQGGSVQVSTSPGGTVVGNFALDTGGRFLATGLGAGAYRFTASANHPQGTGLTGSATATVVAGMRVAVDIALQATGTLQGTVRTPGGQVSANVQVQLSGPGFFRSTTTDSDGTFTFFDVPPGTYTLRTFEPNTGIETVQVISTTANQTVVQNLTLVALGTIQTQVNFARGVGAANTQVNIQVTGPGVSFSRFAGRTDGSGRLTILNVPIGSYTVTAFHPQNNSLVAQAVGTLTTDGETQSRTLTLPAAGTVTGQVLLNSSPVGGVEVTVTAQNSQTFSATTDSGGNYTVVGVPTGPVTARASDTLRQIFGQATGTLADDGATLTLNIAVTASTITLPTTFFDANDFSWDIQPDGDIGAGTNSVFGGDFGNNRGGGRLTIVVGGTATAFAGAPSGIREGDGRQVSIQQSGVGGLDVVRKVFVPRDGYFTRYLELITNPTANLVTADVRVTTHYRSCSGVAQVITTSSGDAVLGVSDPANRDRWLVVDDQTDGDPFVVSSCNPATAEVFDGPNALQRVGAASFDSVGNARRTTLTWSGLSIQPGQTIGILHFLSEQASRAGAQATAERLVQLPPEALAGLGASDRASIMNFAIPDQSALSPLTLGGRVTGLLLDSDQTTPLPFASIRLRSNHPLFGRTYFASTDANGRFNFVARLAGQGGSLVVPDADFTLTAFHPQTSVQVQQTFTNAFAPETLTGNVALGQVAEASSGNPQSAVDGNLNTAWFSNFGDSVSQGRSPFLTVFFPFDVTVTSVNARGSLSGCCFIDRASLETFDASGNSLLSQEFDLVGTPRNADVDVTDQAGVRRIVFRDLADTDSGCCVALAELQILGTALRPLATQNLTFANTGTLTGTVRRFDGSVVATGSVQIQGPGIFRSIGIQSDGTYRLSGLTSGSYTATAFVNGNTGTTTAAVTAGQTTVADITLQPVGAVNGTVRDGGNAAAPNVTVQLFGGNFSSSVATDNAGGFSFTDVPATSGYTLRAFEPNTGIATQTSLSVVAGQTTTRDLQLVALGTLDVQVNFSDGTPAPGSRVDVSTSQFSRCCFFTSGDGFVEIRNVPVGTFSVRAFHPSTTAISVTVTGTLTTHGEVRVVTVTLPPIGAVTGRLTFARGVAAPSATVQISGTSFSQSMSTDSNGNFTFPVVPGDQPLTLRAFHPSNSAVQRTVTGLTVTNGGTTTQDLVLPALASVRVTVQRSDGTPVTDARIDSQDSVNAFLQFRGFTDVNGQLEFAGVPEGAFAILARNRNTLAFLGDVAGSVQPADDAGRVDVTVQVSALTGNVQGRVLGGDGATTVRFAQVELLAAASGVQIASTSSSADGTYGFTNVLGASQGFILRAHSPFDFTVTAQQAATFTTPNQVLTVDLRLPIGVATGQVTFFNGAGVPFPSVSALGFDGRTYFATTTDQFGNFSLVGPPVGPLGVTAQDNASGLAAMVMAQMPATFSVVVNVGLPEAGSVTGHVLDPQGNPAPFASVALTSAGLAFQRFTQADAGGSYAFSQVPVGPVALQALSNSEDLFGNASGNVTGAGATIDIPLLASGTVMGTAFNSDGISPVANAQLTIESFGSVGPLGHFQTSVSADAAGRYSLSGVPPGPIHVVVLDPASSSSAGIADGTLAPNGTLTLDVTLGNAFRFGQLRLDGSDGFRYDVSSDGDLSDGGTADRRLNDAYDGSYFSSVNDLGFSSVSAARLELNGRQAVLGPEALGDFVVARKIFSPPSGGFARYLEIVSNPSGAPRTVTVAVRGNLGSDSSTRIVVSPGATGNTYAVTNESFVNTSACQSNPQDPSCFRTPSDPSLAHVFAGSGSVPVPPSVVQFGPNGSDNITYRWTTTVPAQGTVIFMHFAVQREPTDTAAADVQAQALRALTDPNALTGVTTAERGQIRNFTVSP